MSFSPISAVSSSYSRLRSCHFLRRDAARLPHWVIFAFAYSALPNLPFLIASYKWQFARDGWFCLEYALVGLIALVAPPILASTLLFTTMVVDLICGICRTYFLSPQECLYGIGFTRALPVRSLFVAVSLVVLAATIVFLARRSRAHISEKRDRIHAAICLSTFALLCLGVDSAWQVFTTTQMPVNSRRASYFNMPRLSRVALYRYVGLEELHGGLRGAEEAGQLAQSYFPSAMKAALGEPDVESVIHSSSPPNVVLVLFESWGEASEIQLADALTGTYGQPELNLKYRVLHGEVPFYGGTIAGEARELCSNKLGYHLFNASPAELNECFPHQFASMGYRTIAVHGNTGYFFDRVRWYPRIGFDQTMFHDQLLDQKLPDCQGAFVGTCDASVAKWIGSRLAPPKNAPTFLYWVTLDSHLPVITPTPFDRELPCSRLHTLHASPALCSWYQLAANTHRAVATLALSNLARPTIFVVVGDHAPPFSDSQIRSVFSAKFVPYFILVPRNL